MIGNPNTKQRLEAAEAAIASSERDRKIMAYLLDRKFCLGYNRRVDAVVSEHGPIPKR